VTYETVFTNAKAGMEGVDAEKVKRVVFEASKVRTAAAGGTVCQGHCRLLQKLVQLHRPPHIYCAAGQRAL
jgi:hypothetical protein